MTKRPASDGARSIMRGSAPPRIAIMRVVGRDRIAFPWASRRASRCALEVVPVAVPFAALGAGGLADVLTGAPYFKSPNQTIQSASPECVLATAKSRILVAGYARGPSSPCAWRPVASAVSAGRRLPEVDARSPAELFVLSPSWFAPASKATGLKRSAGTGVEIDGLRWPVKQVIAL